MNDLIKRLRERAARKWVDEANRRTSLFGEAADEIERLTAERDALQSRLSTLAQTVIDTIHSVENRCMAADGPVTLTSEEITEDELKTMYDAARKEKP